MIGGGHLEPWIKTTAFLFSTTVQKISRHYFAVLFIVVDDYLIGTTSDCIPAAAAFQCLFVLVVWCLFFLFLQTQNFVRRNFESLGKKT